MEGSTIKKKYLFVAENRQEDFHYLYCKFCQSKSSLRKFWETHSEKLPSDVSIENLMHHWDELGLSWNSQDVLGCILPNRTQDTVVINASRFVLRPEKHWNTVHQVSKVVG